MITRILAVLIGYLFGNIETSVILARRKGINIREHGSGNAGTTNALRVMGSKAGIVTFLGDFGKMMLAYLTVWLIFGRRNPELGLMLKLYTGLGVILGHDFPCRLGFRGGKGIAVTGALMVLLNWRTGLVAFVLFVGILWFTCYSSLASLLMVTIDSALFLILCSLGVIGMGTLSLTEAAVLISVIWLLAIILHAGNIKRLLTGKENKIFLASYFEKRDVKRGEKKEAKKELRAEKREEKSDSSR